MLIKQFEFNNGKIKRVEIEKFHYPREDKYRPETNPYAGENIIEIGVGEDMVKDKVKVKLERKG